MIAWHGLAPPWQGVPRGISVAHGVMGFIYLATATLLIAPGYFLAALAERRFRLAAVAAVVVTVLGLLAMGLELNIASQVIERLPLALQGPTRLAATLVMAAIASTMAVASLFHLWRLRDDRRQLLLGLLTMLMAGTAAGILWQFSSRYGLAAFPFALLVLQPWLAVNRWAVVRLLIGAALGCASLTSYYRNATPFAVTDHPLAPPQVIELMQARLGNGGSRP